MKNQSPRRVSMMNTPLVRCLGCDEKINPITATTVTLDQRTFAVCDLCESRFSDEDLIELTRSRPERGRIMP